MKRVHTVFEQAENMRKIIFKTDYSRFRQNLKTSTFCSSFHIYISLTSKMN